MKKEAPGIYDECLPKSQFPIMNPVIKCMYAHTFAGICHKSGTEIYEFVMELFAEELANEQTNSNKTTTGAEFTIGVVVGSTAAATLMLAYKKLFANRAVRTQPLLA